MTLNLLVLKDTSIHEQLLLEEKLLRASDKNYCIINTGSTKHIIMGISGKPEELIELEKAREQNVVILKRFSGGGTVVVDENTIFVTFIFNAATHNFASFPEKIHEWSASFYKEVFGNLPFALRENDYVIEDRKVGGNAQYIRKDRWLHHTSFLWTFEKKNMDLLLLPKKRPLYRKDRPHRDFLNTLDNFFISKEDFIEKLLQTLKKNFDLNLSATQDFSSLESPRISTQIVPY